MFEPIVVSDNRLVTAAHNWAQTTPQKIWRLVEVVDREAAIAREIETGSEQTRAHLLLAASRTSKSRLQSVIRWSPQRLAQLIARGSITSVAAATDLLITLHLDYRQELVADLLDQVGIEHENGRLKDWPNEPPCGEGKMLGIADNLSTRYATPHVIIYFLTLLTLNHIPWVHLGEWLQTRIRKP